jgi:inner membrane transporter RhtA
VALIGSRRWSDGLWALGAGGGVVLLATGAGRHLDPAGLALAMLAGTFWAGYILLSKETGRRFDSLNGLAWAMTTGGLALLPWGLLNAGATLLRPSVLGLGAVVAVMASVIPYSLELLALRRVTPRAFGVMMSLDPGLATAAGFLVLGQRLTLQEWLALGLVVAANVGNALAGRPRDLGMVA